MRHDRPMKDLRSLMVKVVVASFTITALFGIATLLFGGSLDGTAGQVLGTTGVVGIEAVAILCYLAVADTRRSWVGIAGGVVSLVPFGIVLWAIWMPETGLDFPWRVFGVGLTIAASLAQVCLLLAATQRPRPVASRLLGATLVAVAVVAVMIIVPIVGELNTGDVYWRLFGVVAILDVLGTIVTIVLARFVTTPSGEAGRAGPEALPALEPVAHERLVLEAQRRGVSPSALVLELLDRETTR